MKSLFLLFVLYSLSSTPRITFFSFCPHSLSARSCPPSPTALDVMIGIWGDNGHLLMPHTSCSICSEAEPGYAV